MKKYIISLLLLSFSLASISQTVQQRLGAKGQIYYDTITTLPRTPLFTINGYGNPFASNTDSIGIEGVTNLWFTNARARAAISLTTTGTSGAATYNSSTGVFNIPQYSGGGGGTITSQTLTDTTTIVWNITLGTVANVTLKGNRILSITNNISNSYYQLRIVQDTTGFRAITWPSGIKWINGTAPVLSTAANSEDIITFWYNGTNYYGNYGYNYK